MTISRIAAAVLLALGAVNAENMSAQQTAQPAQTPPPAASPDSQEPVRPDQQPTFRAGVSFVRVDVIVTDKKGEPVGNLSLDDFEVLEDGKRQAIEQFKLIRVDGNLKPGGEPLREIRTAYDQELEAGRDDVRLFVIFLDDYHTRAISALSVKDPLTRFIQTQLGPTDLVAIMYPLTPLDAVQFTRNHGSIVSAIQRFEGRKFDYLPRNQFEEQYANYPTEVVEQIRNQVVMTALRGLSVRLGSLREGRKAIIYVSEGLGGMLPPSMRNADAQAPTAGITRADTPYEESAAFFAQTDLMNQLREVYGAANRNNAAIYTLDPRGLATNEFHIDEPGVSAARDRRILAETQDTLRAMAEETDGRAIVNRNDLAKGLEQVVRDSSAYYLIGYNSSQAPADGKFHEIKVRVKRPGVQVRARKGYIAPTLDDLKRATAPPKPAAPKPVQQALASLSQPAVAGRVVRSWIGTARGENGRTRVTYVWEPVPAAPGVRRDQAARVSLLAADAQGELVFRGRVPDGNGPAPVGASPTGAAGAPSAQPRQITFEAAPGKLELRISVEAAAGGVLDNEVRELVVPDLSAAPLILSTPRVFRARTVRDVQALAADPAAVPVPGRDFSRTERVIIRFDVHGTGTLPAPTAALLNRAGQRMTAIPVASAPAGGSHQIDLALGSISPGEYLIEISVTGNGTEVKELVPLKVGS